MFRIMNRVFLLSFLTLLWVALLPGPAMALEFTDDSGRTIKVERPFTRIISLYGAHTENLFALGLDQEIIGVTRHEVFPPQALTKPAFHYRDGPEKFMAAKPDLVLIRPMIFQGYAKLADSLTRAGITVVSLQPTSPKEMFQYWTRLGQLTGKEKETQDLVSGFKSELARLKFLSRDIPLDQRKRVFLEAIHSKMKTFAPEAMAVFALESAGGVNLASDAQAVRGTNIASYGRERLLAKAAQVDVYLAQTGPMNKVDQETILSDPAFQAIKAVQEKQVFLIDEQIVSRPTPRLLQGVEAMGRILYPERFK